MNKRLTKITEYISKNDSVIDVGCDHGYLTIYLYKYKLCKNVFGSDISKNALEYAINNSKKENLDIKFYVSDGLKDIKDYYDTIVISGMGTHTIMNILSNRELPNKIILSSNNDYYILRKFMYSLGYNISKEDIVKENNKYYDIICFIKGKKNIKKKDLILGFHNNIDYYNYLINKNILIMKKVPLKKKLQLLKENKLMKKKISLIEKM